MNFRDALISTYCANPCRVLPNALWKTLAWLEDLHTYVRIEEGVAIHMEAWDEKRLLVYWTSNRELSQAFSPHPNNLKSVLMHEDNLLNFPSEGFSIRTPYFRLMHKPVVTEIKGSTPSGFSIVEAVMPKEAGKAADLIRQCYPDIAPSAETILNWSGHPTFDPSLWVWVLDHATGLPAGLGIAEIDSEISEGSLEWIQVLPTYRGMGIGKMLVQELLSRLGKRVKFTTVSGKVDRTSHPEALYRSCGFEGTDVWWLLRR